MKFSILSIGTELTLGLISNTNSQYIAEALTNIGLECTYIITVQDKEEDIINFLKICEQLSDIVIICGGLGPTDDDLTRQAVAKYFNTKLIKVDSLDKTSLKFLSYIKNENLIESLTRQSYIPQNSIAIKPRIGSASGFIINRNGKVFFAVPGVPREMKDMFDKDVVAYIKKFLLKKENKVKEKYIKKLVLLATDISESQLEFHIKSLKKLATNLNIEIGITANPGLIKIILVSSSDNTKKCEQNLEIFKKEVINLLGQHIYLCGDGSIGDSIKNAILSCQKNYQNRITISAAESITGGLVSSLITDTPGSSEYFLGSIVSYTNFSKETLLKIDDLLIKKHGAVSKEVCAQMAKNCKEIFKSDFAISVTGFAGPTVNEKNKDIGLVYACIYYPDDYNEIYEKKFIGIRTDIKFRTAQFILNRLRLAILKTYINNYKI